MEIRIDMSHTNNELDLGTANFVFVGRTKDKGYNVPKLVFDGETERDKSLLRDEYGKKNQNERKTFSAVLV